MKLGGIVRDYKIWRAWRRFQKTWKEVIMNMVPSVGDKPAAKSLAIGGASMLFGPEMWEGLVELFPPLADLAQSIGLPFEVTMFIRKLVPFVQALGGLVMIFGLRRAQGLTKVAAVKATASAEKAKVAAVEAKAAASIVTLALLSTFLAAPAFAWPEADYSGPVITRAPTPVAEMSFFNIGPSIRSCFGIPRGGTLGESDYNVAASAVGYFTRNHWALLGEFGAGSEETGVLAGLRFGYVFAGWIMPHASIDSRGIGEEGKASIGGGGGIAFMVPLSDGSGMMLDLKAVDYGPGRHGGSVVSLGTTVLLSP